ncbi:hypothetical protein ACE193_20880 [Bernardetia sp. OM2101]|uniref:hypothetical protein n=1 Tax=Bernardetia sp. OM2101 TaxID=3344876 RepID=UPI0035CF8B84
MIFFGITTDIQAHSNILKESVYYYNFPIPPLYYLSIYIISGFNRIFSINNASIFVLSLAMVGKYLASLQLANHIYPNTLHSFKNTYLFLGFIACILFLNPIFYDFQDYKFYLGRIAISAWHNSTIIFLMPFAVLLFCYSLEFIESNTIHRKNICYIIILGTINLLIKPSFLFIFIPSFPLMILLWEKKFNKKVTIGFSISSALFIGIIILYCIIYLFNNSTSVDSEQSNIGIAPFLLFNSYSTNFFVDFIISTLFPIISLLIIKELKNIFLIRYSILLYIFAFLIAAFIVETGPRLYHGNFGWQLIVANYMLFLVISIFVFKKIQQRKIKIWKTILLSSIFLLHFISGIGYLFKIIIVGNIG